MCSCAGREHLAKSVITKSGSASEAAKDFWDSGIPRPEVTNNKPTEQEMSKVPVYPPTA